MVFLYSFIVVAPMHFAFPLANIGFNMFEASIAPSAPPAPTIVCISSMNKIMLLLFSNSLTILFIFSSNSPLYFVPDIMLARLMEIIILFFRIGGMFLVTILLANSSTIAVLPTPASPISIGLFLFFLASISIMRSISESLPITLSISLFITSSFKFVPNSVNMLFSLFVSSFTKSLYNKFMSFDNVCKIV